MFYVKTKINEGTYFTTEITDENVYTSCIDCGRELQIDLDEAVVEGHLDLFGLGMRCETCSYRHALQHRGEPWAEQLIADYQASNASKG